MCIFLSKVDCIWRTVRETGPYIDFQISRFILADYEEKINCF